MAKPIPNMETAAVLQTRELSVYAGSRTILHKTDLTVMPYSVLGILGPSGAGKSTLIKCLNRLIELTPTLRVTGDILFKGESIFASHVDVDALRSRIGMIFQQPVVFPASIRENVLFGAARLQRLTRQAKTDLVEKALREAALWNELKDRLRESALRLSVGQQQRLCLARTLALNPEVILMDEPTSALDPKATEAIEQLISSLKATRTIVLVTHNHRQAEAVCDRTFVMKPFGAV